MHLPSLNLQGIMLNKSQSWNWRDGSEFKSTGCSSRGPWVQFPALTWQFTTSITPVQGLRYPLLASEGTRHSSGAQIYMQAIHTYLHMCAHTNI